MDNATHPASARGVCFAYDGHDVLHDISAHLPRGTVTAITGPNGSGKSTLVELLAGVRPPRRGIITRHGTLALVVQRPTASDALPVTVREVVAMGTWGRRGTRAERRRAIAHAIDRLALTGLEDRPLAELSGGQRQRTLLAQGIVQYADILLLDEPAAGLDAASRQRTREILAEEATRGAAIACVTHDDDSTATADRVIRLDSGHLVTWARRSRDVHPPFMRAQVDASRRRYAPTSA